MPKLPRVELAHMGLWVTDLDMMVDFYTRLYGFHISDRGSVGGRDLAFLTLSPNDHHQLLLASGRPKEVSFNVLNQISFRVASLGDVRSFYEALQSEPVTQIRPMTHGNAWSVYFHDPEGNRSEVFCDTPWHINQPFGVEIDLTKPDEEIVRLTEEMIRDNDTRRPFIDWRRDAARELGRPDVRLREDA